MRFAAVFVAAFVCVGAFASEPGQPLDCSDFVFYQPGFSCSEGPASLSNKKGSNLVLDNSGRQITLSNQFPVGGSPVQIVVSDPQGTTSVLGEITGRQVSNGTFDGIRTLPDQGCTVGVNGYECESPKVVSMAEVLWFDAVNGVLFFPAMAYCSEPVGSHVCSYAGAYRVFRIGGFARLIDIFQSYQPPSAPLSFRVPALPDGLVGADHFDTYWGDLATVGDWSKAKGLRCNYPAAAPTVGDYFEVPDTLATPAPGQGVYYVTAATYKGATRYGRKTTGGHLSGRDPALLPTCSTVAR